MGTGVSVLHYSWFIFLQIYQSSLLLNFSPPYYLIKPQLCCCLPISQLWLNSLFSETIWLYLFLSPLQAGPSLYLPSSNCSAQYGDPNSCSVHHFSLHRLHNGKPGLLAVHHCCLRPVSLCSFSCCWLCGIRVHGCRSSTCHDCRSTNSSTHNFCAVSTDTAATRPYAIETHLQKDLSSYEGMQRHGCRENKGKQ